MLPYLVRLEDHFKENPETAVSSLSLLYGQFGAEKSMPPIRVYMRRVRGRTSIRPNEELPALSGRDYIRPYAE